MPCEFCTDPDGDTCFPVYGLAPHRHMDFGWKTVTTFDDPSEWPDNFTQDPNDSQMGTYHCPKCGHGKPDKSD